MALAKTITWREVTSWRKHIYYVRAKNDLRLSTSLTRREAKDILLYAQSTHGASDRFDCAVCGQSYDKSAATLEHIVPQTDFGSLNITNQVLTCRDCNPVKSWKYTLAGARDVLKGKGKEVNEAVANDAVRRAKRVVDLFMNFEYVDEHYIEPMERRREANRRKIEELLRGLSEDARVRAELLGQFDDIRTRAGLLGSGRLDDIRITPGLLGLGRLGNIRTRPGLLGPGRLDDIGITPRLLELGRLNDIGITPGLLELGRLDDIRTRTGLLGLGRLDDIRITPGLLELGRLDNIRRMQGLIGQSIFHPQSIESQLRDSLLRQPDVFEEFDNLFVRLINALNVAIDVKSAEADSTPGNKP